MHFERASELRCEFGIKHGDFIREWILAFSYPVFDFRFLVRGDVVFLLERSPEIHADKFINLLEVTARAFWLNDGASVDVNARR